MKKLYINKYCFILIYLLFASVFSVKGQSYIPAGNVTGTWQVTGSPYYIEGEITIPESETLTIESGVKVVFMGHFKFNVQGRLLAVGTQQDTVFFTADNKESGWHGIRFMSTPETNDTSKIVFCSFKHGNANTGSGLDRCGGAILISRFDKVVVSNCLFDSNKQSGDGWSPPEGSPAIYVYFASSIIRNSKFTNNQGSKGSAVGCISCPNAIVSNNIFLNNRGAFGPIVYASNSNGIISGNIIANNVSTWGGGGILIDNALTGGSSSPRLENNIISNNQAPKGGGIYCLTNTNPVFINNTIAYNNANSGGGVCCETNSDPVFINNIIWGNSSEQGSQVSLIDMNSDPNFLYNVIHGENEEFGGYGSGLNYSGIYESNFDMDPMFKDTAAMDYNLSDLSPCIGIGVDSLEVSGTWYYTPQFDFNENPRPVPAGSFPDLGACESLLGSPTVGVEHDFLIPDIIILEQNYPNPFNSKTTIKYSVPESSNVVLKIYNIIGKEIETLINAEKPAGTYEVNWHATNFPNGIYFYRLQAGNFLSAKKMILQH